MLSRSSFTEGLLVCPRAAVIRWPSAVCPFRDALVTERHLARCHHLARVPTSSDWLTQRDKGLAILIPIWEQASSRGHSGVPQVVPGPSSQLDISLCPILIPSPFFHRPRHQENSFIKFCSLHSISESTTPGETSLQCCSRGR